MKVVCVAVAVLGLLSVGQSAPVSSCESLIKTLEIQGTDQLVGKWMYIAESTDIPGSKAMTKMLVESGWCNLTSADQSGKMKSFLNQKMLGFCFAFQSEWTLENNILSMAQPYPATAVFLNTSCPDCLVVYSDNILGSSSYKGLQLLSKRGSVSVAELEEYKKQVECVNLPSPTVMDPDKGFCPDPSESQETTTIDITGSVTSDDLSLLDRIIKSQNGVQMLLKLITNSIGQFKQS